MTLFLFSPSKQGAETLAPGESTRMGLPLCSYLFSCFPATSVTSMPLSICFTSFPGLLTLVNPVTREERGKVWFPELDAKTLRKTGHLDGTWWITWPPGSSESKTCLAEATDRIPAQGQEVCGG